MRVKFLCYRETMQARCLRLMGKKLLVALALEGKFAGEGLQALDEDDDMLTAMARELVEKNGIGESADAVWKTLNGEHRRIFGEGAQASNVSVKETIELQESPAGLNQDGTATTPVFAAWPAGNPQDSMPVQGLLFE